MAVSRLMVRPPAPSPAPWRAWRRWLVGLWAALTLALALTSISLHGAVGERDRMLVALASEVREARQSQCRALLAASGVRGRDALCLQVSPRR